MYGGRSIWGAALAAPAVLTMASPGDTTVDNELTLEQMFDSLEVPPASAEVADFQADGCFTSAKAARDFFLAGNATGTLVSKRTGARFTFKVRKPDDGDGQFFFVSVLNGPDNWQNYAYIGYVRRKIDNVEPKLIHTIRGVGYTLRLP